MECRWIRKGKKRRERKRLAHVVECRCMRKRKKKGEDREGWPHVVECRWIRKRKKGGGREKGSSNAVRKGGGGTSVKKRDINAN